MSAKQMSSQQLCDAIYHFVLGAKKPQSRRDICEGIGRHKSPHIIRMIDHLAANGYFKKETRIDEFNREGFIYSSAGKKQQPDCS